MTEGGEPGLRLEIYAEMLVAISDPSEDRARVLAERGLDESQWDAIDRDWRARLAAAGADELGTQGPPSLVISFAEAFGRAQRARVSGVLSFDKYVEATRAVHRGIGVAEALEKLRVPLPTYLKAHEHWMRAMATDSGLAEQFARRMR